MEAEEDPHAASVENASTADNALNVFFIFLFLFSFFSYFCDVLRRTGNSVSYCFIFLRIRARLVVLRASTLPSVCINETITSSTMTQTLTMS